MKLCDVVQGHRFNLQRQYTKVPEEFWCYAVCSEHLREVVKEVYESGVVPVRDIESGLLKNSVVLYGVRFMLAAHDARVYPPVCLFCSLQCEEGR